MATKKVETVEIKEMQKKYLKIKIVGDTPLIMHNYTEKAKKQLRDIASNAPKLKNREAKNTTQEFIECMNWLTPMPEEKTMEAFDKAWADGCKIGFPISGIKQGSCAAPYRNKWVKDQVSIKGSFFLRGEDDPMFITIHSDKPIMREDPVTIGMGSTELRYRPQFNNWYGYVYILYNSNGQYSIEEILNFINAAGFSCGLGEDRPEKKGNSWGMYHVEPAENQD